MAEFVRFEDVDYRVIDKKAEVGDLIYYEVDEGERGISRVVADGFEPDDFYTEDGAYIWVAMGDVYRVVGSASTPSVTDLIANLARRVSELEACLAVEQAHREDLTEQNAQQAYEINELYRAFVRKEAQI